jgi:hypothetical protein
MWPFKTHAFLDIEDAVGMAARMEASVYTPAMTLKNAAIFAFIGMTLLTIVCALGFIGDMSALLASAIAPMMVLSSLIHLLATVSVAVFLYVFQKRSLE